MRNEDQPPKTTPLRLVDRFPQVEPRRLLQEMVPPARFADVRFDTYEPVPEYPSQAQARVRIIEFSQRLGERKSRWRRARAQGKGVYLDGGFGVGKTHLLASLWFTARNASYGTFVEYTNLVGALGFATAVQALSEYDLICIDEFELDDPGDTVLMARLLRELSDHGVALAATSNTLPEALGAGRFAAEDFMREIQALSSRFDVVSIDGEDYRHRDPMIPDRMWSDERIDSVLGEQPRAAIDDFDVLMEHLRRVHPSRYGMMIEGLDAVGWHGVETLSDQAVALRLVVLVDRLYDARVPVCWSGVGAREVFTEEMLAGGYKKKYFRALSRLRALGEEAWKYLDH